MLTPRELELELALAAPNALWGIVFVRYRRVAWLMWQLALCITTHKAGKPPRNRKSRQILRFPVFNSPSLFYTVTPVTPVTPVKPPGLLRGAGSLPKHLQPAVSATGKPIKP